VGFFDGFPLTLTVFLMVLAAAVMHAGWNVLVKLRLDRFSAVVLLQSVLGLMGLAMIFIYGLPEPSAWRYAAVACVVHTFYLIFLAKAYEAGDFGIAYPIARGSAPFFTLIGSLLFTGDVIHPLAAAGILVLIAGLMCLAFLGARGDITQHRKALFYALATAAMISCYTLLDGLGARAAGNATQYAGLAFFLYGLAIFVTGLALRGPRLVGQLLPYWKTGMVGGIVSGIAYWMVIWCMAQAPIAMVAALRETSVLFGLVMSSYVLKEKLTATRILGCLLIVAGAVVLRLA
jgi:drug/metabolite transporter (DMT)-like permease